MKQASFTEPTTLADAFDGAEQVLLVSANVLGEEALRLHANAIQTAKDAAMVAMLVSMFEAIRDGKFDVVDPTLERVLTRRPTELEPVLTASLSKRSSTAENHESGGRA